MARPTHRAAILVGQPPVIGEIALGLVIVPLITTAAGSDVVDTLLPIDVTDHLHTLGLAGLALYLASVGHSARPRRDEVSLRSYGWPLGGSLLPGLLAGVLLAVWVDWRDAPGERGTAPTAALLLLLAAALAVTAVPVLARILTDRGLVDSTPGQLSLLVAVGIDALTWLILTAALATAAGGGGQHVRAVVVIAGGAVTAVLLRRLLGQAVVGRLCARRPVVAALLLGALAVGRRPGHRAGGAHRDLRRGPGRARRPPGRRTWAATRAVGTVERYGLLLVPVFFVTTGLQISTDGPDGFSWLTLALVLLLATAARLAVTRVPAPQLYRSGRRPVSGC